MIVPYLLLTATTVVIFLAFSKGCKLMALINILEEAKRESAIPDEKVITEVDKVFTVLCYLLGATVTIIFLFKVLYEKH